MIIHKNSGLSSIEVLVLFGIGIVLVNGVIQVIMTNNTITRAIKGYSTLQENARFALQDLTDALLSAGYYTSIHSEAIATPNTLKTDDFGDCDKDWMLNAARYVRGFEGQNSIGSVKNFPQACIPSDQYAPGSDIVVLRYTKTKAADRAQEKNINLSKRHNSATTEGMGAYRFQYKTTMYYIRPCRALNESNCEDGLHTLVRQTLKDGTLITEDIAEGVEQLQLEYGVDSVGEDSIADIYMTANNILDWDSVVSVRFSLVVRSENRNADKADTNTYNLAGGYEYTPKDAVAHYTRKAFTRLIQLRNMH